MNAGASGNFLLFTTGKSPSHGTSFLGVGKQPSTRPERVPAFWPSSMGAPEISAEATRSHPLDDDAPGFGL